MDANRLFTSALGLQTPWQVSDIRLAPEPGEIQFDLACDAKRLDCPAFGETDQPIHDRVRRTWQHVHLFRYPACMHAPLQRVKCGHRGKVTQVEAPWVRPGSDFTLLMAALVLRLARKPPVAAIARWCGVSEHRLWRTINGHVEAARATTSYAELAAYRFGASHAVADSINNQIQVAIVRTRGFQSLRSLTHIIFLTTGKLAEPPGQPLRSTGHPMRLSTQNGREPDSRCFP